MITPLQRTIWPIYGRVAVAYVQGSPKGGGAWIKFVSGYHNPALVGEQNAFAASWQLYSRRI